MSTATPTIGSTDSTTSPKAERLRAVVRAVKSTIGVYSPRLLFDIDSILAKAFKKCSVEFTATCGKVAVIHRL